MARGSLFSRLFGWEDENEQKSTSTSEQEVLGENDNQDGTTLQDAI